MKWTPPEPAFVGQHEIAPHINETKFYYYTLAQLQAVRREAIEECAKVCDEHAEYPSLTPKHCADAIRELLEQK